MNIDILSTKPNTRSHNTACDKHAMSPVTIQNTRVTTGHRNKDGLVPLLSQWLRNFTASMTLRCLHHTDTKTAYKLHYSPGQQTLDKYSQDHPELNSGLRLWKNRLIKADNQERESSSIRECCKNLDTLCENWVLVTKLCAKPLKGVKIWFLVF